MTYSTSCCLSGKLLDLWNECMYVGTHVHVCAHTRMCVCMYVYKIIIQGLCVET
jgi:hypothetical protein